MSVRSKEDFFTALQSGKPIMFDGAMGSALYERGYVINRAFDEANLTSPETVVAIHKSHLLAGAEVIETNTFSANKFLLTKYGIRDKVFDVNKAGVQLAKRSIEESQRSAWIAGSIGPTGEGFGVLSEDKAKEISLAFREQIEALYSEGITIFLLETFRHLQEIKIAIDEVRRAVPDACLIAQMSFTEQLTLEDGTQPGIVATLLEGWGANVVGVNCGLGPSHVYQIAVAMVQAVSPTPVLACPNAGYPSSLDNRSIYMSTPEYFGLYAKRMLKSGVTCVGGCCGVTDKHLKCANNAVRMQRSRVATSPLKSKPTGDGITGTSPTSGAGPVNPSIPTLPPIPVQERSRLAEKVYRVFSTRLNYGKSRGKPKDRSEFVVSVEVNPAQGLDVSKRVEIARNLINSGVDVINIADGPRATVRMNNAALGLKIQEAVGCEVILHVCCRDRNLLGLQSDLLGYHVLGLNNLVVITGDTPKMGDYPKATAVFDMNSTELLGLINGFNRGVDPAGKMVGEQTKFFLITGAEPGAVDYEKEIKKLKQKIRAGAELIMTQPVYDPEVLSRFLDDVEPLGVPVLMGLCPLVSHRNAEFLHNEVPGMSVPANIRERMKRAGTGAPAQREGIQIAREMIEQFMDRVVGVYIMPQLGKYDSALKVVDLIPGYSSPTQNSL